MPVDCSMTNWFYNLIKATRAKEGGGDKQRWRVLGPREGCSFESLMQIPVSETDAGLS